MQDNINFLIANFYIIRNMGWIKSMRGGPTGIGYTFESLLGKCEDSLPIPDFDNIEIKTHRSKSKSYINLFNYNPIGSSSYELKRIFEKYGYLSVRNRERRVLYCSVYSDYIVDVGLNYKFSLRIDYDMGRVYLLIFDRLGNFIEKESYWDFDTLRDKIYSKMKVLAYIEADSMYKNGVEYFKYKTITFYRIKGFDTFIDLLRKGKICVNFKVSGYSDEQLGLIDSHGVSFCIKSSNLNLLYEHIC